MITVHVPTMSSRQDVRAVSGCLSDVPGVETIRADLATRTVRVTGAADPAAVTATVATAGYVAELAVEQDVGELTRHPFATTGGPKMDTFPADTAGLPAAGPGRVLELADGDELELRLAPVSKQLADSTVRMLAYNGSVPGPTLRLRQGSRLLVHVTNDTDLETTVHWHGLRLDNRYDGVPDATQPPIPPGGHFTYLIPFPDPGLFWYHPHVREDYTQEMGLYGTILVDPSEPDYWPQAHRDVVLTLDDVLLHDGAIAPFSKTETDYAAMGRYGNTLLIAGEPDLALTAKTGEVVRLWMVNTANSRVFRVTVPEARMKLVGGDNGRTEHEQLVDDVVVAPSERAVVDVLMVRPGLLNLEHHTPDRAYRLATITVHEQTADPLEQASGVRPGNIVEVAADNRGPPILFGLACDEQELGVALFNVIAR